MCGEIKLVGRSFWPAMYGAYQSQSALWKEESWERSNYLSIHPPPACTAVTRHRETLCHTMKNKLNNSYSALKDRCLTQYIICSARNFHCRTIYHKHFFWNKATIIILLLNTLYSMAIYGVTAEMLQIILGSDYVLVRVLIIYGITQLLFPLAGHAADTYIGRHNVVRFSLWCAWLSFALVGLSFSLDRFNNKMNFINCYVVLPIAFVLLSISYMCFMSNIIPFGLDQLQGASHVHYTSFLYWWYWTLKVGAVVVAVPQYCAAELELGMLIQAGIGLVCLTTALLLDALFKDWFVLEPCCSKQGNPLRQIARVLAYMVKMPSQQHVPSSVRHEIDFSNCSRLDFAKKRYGGKYETEQVEDVRTFFSVLLVLVAVGLLILPYSGVINTLSLIQTHMSDIAQLDVHWNNCGLEVSLLNALNVILLLVLIPFLDLVVIPILRHMMLQPSILKCLGLGGVLIFTSVLSVFTLEGVVEHYSSSSEARDGCMFASEGISEEMETLSGYWLIIPMVLVTLAEILLYVPSFEFICAQAPYNMRGLLIGLFFSIHGFFSLLSALLQYLFSWKPIITYPFQPLTGYSCSFWFYLIIALLAGLGVCFYSVVACKYKRRKRDDVFNQVGMIEEYYSSGRIHSSHWI